MPSGPRFNPVTFIAVVSSAILCYALISEAATTKKPNASAANALRAKKTKSKAKRKTDYNALGNAAWKKKNFTEALKQYNLATINDPKNYLSWINNARAIIAINISNEPEDYCDYAHNWIFDALSSLSTAIDVNRIKTIAALRTLNEASFKKFRNRLEFKKWIFVTKLPLKSDTATQDFFAKNNDWLLLKQPMPPTIVTFSPNHDLTITSAEGQREVGTWTPGVDRVVVKTSTAPRTMNLTIANFPYNGGKSFKQVVVKDKTEQWVMGPEIADCPE